MAVKIRKELEVMGKKTTVTQYLPADVSLTRDRREKADALDKEIEVYVKAINEDYEKLPDEIKKNTLEKWRWVGGRLDDIQKKLKNLEALDINTHIIWPAFAQYMRGELQRGYDAKRSGTRKDHYRKAWLLASLDNLSWIKTWGGWDAFVDRGEQLTQSYRLMHLLNNKFNNYDISTGEYQALAKTLTKSLPSFGLHASDINSMDDDDLVRLVNDLYIWFIQSRDGIGD